jgi:transposase
MSESTRQNIDSDPVLIGLDWAKAKHDYCLLGPQEESENGQVEHDEGKLRQWLDSLSERFEGRRLRVCLEDGRQALLWLLEKHPRVDLFVVNTATAARYRKTFAPSGDKNDRRDAASILDLLIRHPEKVRPYRQCSPQARALHLLSQARRTAVDRRTGLISSLREAFELHYPVASKLFDDLSSPIALAFFKHWPDPVSLRGASEATLVDFFRQHNSRSKSLIATRLELINTQSPPDEDPILLEVARLRIGDHLGQIQALNEAIANYERRIDEVFSSHEKMPLFSDLPGAAKKLAPRLLAAFCLIDPKDALEMQIRTGVAPIRVQSGGSMKVFMRQHCPKFLRQSFHEFAGCSVKSSAWAKAFYDDQTKVKRKTPHAAKRALAYKWIRILYACWKENKPYNEMEYIAALQKRKSHLAEMILQN